ncbi:hypothetical protein AGMMS49531_10530 [Endomicrobiia bacterium]|nr:hypothetical protein AGMMS49531_10530 [Endomicrobiia bacterium]
MEVLVYRQRYDIDKVTYTLVNVKCYKHEEVQFNFYSLKPKDTDEITFIKTLKQLDPDMSIITIRPIIINDSSHEFIYFFTNL